MGQQNFEHVKLILLGVIKALHGGAGDSFQYALVQYSGMPHTEFKLNTYNAVGGALAHIMATCYRGGGNRTGLDFLLRAHLNAAAGSRAGEAVAQLVVVLTDGRSQDDVSEPARVLHLAGVEVFAVGVQGAVDWELREMASQPHDSHVLSVDSFQALRDITQDLVVGRYSEPGSGGSGGDGGPGCATGGTGNARGVGLAWQARPTSERCKVWRSSIGSVGGINGCLSRSLCTQ
ncbi:Collagen alpha-3(VI) chain [Merluccius polli]|uniref:Collagen alpha-3(VI) chain n=1 Tax=Merluccius polli TaxID=89951 RepID=A0AA47MEU5_MERPO|nr:Collagen alpha-3(VI) chain [Merluccius polli]